MASYEYIEKYIDSGLINTANMAFWHSVVPAETGNDVIFDYSGNERTASTANASEPPANPVVQANVLDGRPGIYFDGEDSPLAYVAEDMLLNHIFVLAKYDGATFDPGEDCLMAPAFGISSLLLGQGLGDVNFYDLGFDAFGYTYRKNDVLYPEDAQEAPMNEWGLMELRFPSAIECSGIQYGRDREESDRRWKGWFIDGMGFTSLQSETERARILLQYKLKYPSLNIPLVFPTPDVIGLKGWARFYDEPRKWRDITTVHTYQDKGVSFNRSADTPPRKWEVIFALNNKPLAKRQILDDFADVAGIDTPFTFTDKYGVTWEDVYIENYDRNHPGHESWKQTVKFDLIKYP